MGEWYLLAGSLACSCLLTYGTSPVLQHTLAYCACLVWGAYTDPAECSISSVLAAYASLPVWSGCSESLYTSM